MMCWHALLTCCWFWKIVWFWVSYGGKMRLQKEISKSFVIFMPYKNAAIDWVSTTWEFLVPRAPSSFKNICIINLGSGKGITTALCGALNAANGSLGSNNWPLQSTKCCLAWSPTFWTTKGASISVETSRRTKVWKKFQHRLVSCAHARPVLHPGGHAPPSHGTKRGDSLTASPYFRRG